MRLQLTAVDLEPKDVGTVHLEQVERLLVCRPRCDSLRANLGQRVEADAPAGEEVLDDEGRVDGCVDVDVRGPIWPLTSREASLAPTLDGPREAARDVEFDGLGVLSSIHGEAVQVVRLIPHGVSLMVDSNLASPYHSVKEH